MRGKLQITVSNSEFGLEASASKPKEAFSVLCRLSGEDFKGQVANLRHCCGCLPHERRLAAFAAMGNGREVRGIGLYHNPFAREQCGNLAQVPGVVKGNDSGKRNIMAEIDGLLRLLQGSTETMEHAVKMARIRAENL